MAVLTAQNNLDPEAVAAPLPRRRWLRGRFPTALFLVGCSLAGPPGATQGAQGLDVPALTKVARIACATGHSVNWVKPFIGTKPSGEKIRLAILYLERLQ